MSKNICITGCTKGLGLAIAKWFLANGWQVSGIGRNQFSIDSLQSQGNGYFRAVDVTDDIALGLFAKELADKFAPPGFALQQRWSHQR
jgi:NADP-dependent 3-hydroxy acid dehydrogenase YdfG